MPTLLIVQVGLDRAVRNDENLTRETESETKSEFVARATPTSVMLNNVVTMDTRFITQGAVSDYEEAPGFPELSNSSQKMVSGPSEEPTRLVSPSYTEQ